MRYISMSKQAIKAIPDVELRVARDELDRKRKASMRLKERDSTTQELRVINAEIARRPKLPGDVFK